MLVNTGNKVYGEVFFDAKALGLAKVERLGKEIERLFEGSEGENYELMLSTALSGNLQDIVEGLYEYNTVFAVAITLLSVITAMFFTLNIYNYIKSKRRDIVVLRMLGMSKTMTAVPFLLLFGVVFVVQLALALAISAVFITAVNAVFATQAACMFNLLHISEIVLPAMVVGLIALQGLAVLGYTKRQHSKSARQRYDE